MGVWSKKDLIYRLEKTQIAIQAILKDLSPQSLSAFKILAANYVNAAINLVNLYHQEKPVIK